MTAKVVVSSAGSRDETGEHERSSVQTISNMTINATGCDIGVYVAPGNDGVVLKHLTITGANDHAVFVQDSSRVVLKDSSIMDNGLAPHTCPTPLSPPPCIRENKAVEFVGTTNSVIINNLVKGNMADGGVGVSDDGPDSVGGNPGALTARSTAPHPSVNVQVVGNMILDNSNGCGIVVASYDANVGVKNIIVNDNTVIGAAPGKGPFGGPGSFYGQIVIAGDGPFATVSNVRVTDNIVDGSLLPGIVLHANVFGDKIVNTIIRDNTLTNNGWYPPFFEAPGDTNVPLSPNTTGISIVAEVGIFPPALGPAPVISHTIVSSNTVSGDHTGVWLCGTNHTIIHDLDGNPAVRVATCAAGGN